MSDPFPFDVGDSVRLDNWVPDSYVTVDWLGRSGFVGHNTLGGEGWNDFVVTYKGQRRTWSRYEPPVVYPERWINVYPGQLSKDHYLWRDAADLAACPDRIAILHLHPDGTTTMEAL